MNVCRTNAIAPSSDSGYPSPACALELHVQRHRRLDDAQPFRGGAIAPTIGDSVGVTTLTSALWPLIRTPGGVARTVVMPAAASFVSSGASGVDVIGRHHVRPQDQVALPALRLVERADRGAAAARRA